MKNKILFALILLIFGLSTFASSPPMFVPPAPSIPINEAIILAEKYVDEMFPTFDNLYCSEVTYDANPMTPDDILWRLKYRLAGNPRIESKENPYPFWGDCLVFVRKDGSVKHSTEPVDTHKLKQP